MKSTYIVCTLIFWVFLLFMSVVTPIYFTPGYYWWTAAFLLIFYLSSLSFNKVAEKWLYK